jgi:2-polyprenyl-3-methyl-5-hydroxy-6-metoxy-1,4-benzoquinol methylase
MEALIDKWNQIYSQCEPDDLSATEVLKDNAFLLPKSGNALDLACGLGANAIFLAHHGLAVAAWDLSPVAIAKLTAHSRLQGLNISACEKNITSKSLEKSCYDIITVSRFLDRTLTDAIIAALKPDGLLFYQTYTKQKTFDQGPRNPAFLLKKNELLELFSPLTVIYYRENGRCGELMQGLRNEAQFIGQNHTI